MQNVIDDAIVGTIMVCILSILIIIGIIDNSLSIFWKGVVAVLAGILIYGTIGLMKEQKLKAKKYIDNKEDLR